MKGQDAHFLKVQVSITQRMALAGQLRFVEC